MLNYGDHNSFSDLFIVFLRTIDHLNLKLRIFSGHNASLKNGVLKVQDFENFELSPMQAHRHYRQGCTLYIPGCKMKAYK